MACFLNEVHYTAKLAGSRMPGRRLDPCLLMALDEIANIAPINIPNFMADSGGRGIQLAIVSHGLGQLRDRWGEQGAQIISDTAGCKIFLPGITDTALLKAANNGHADMGRFLLSKGANPAIEHESGMNALSLAIKGRHDEVIALLEHK